MLQMVQNSAVRLITRQRRCEYQYIAPSSLTVFHWLPVRWRINYKILLLTYHALHDLASTYIVDTISPHTPGRRLCSAVSNLLPAARHDMERYGRRGFYVTAPRCETICRYTSVSLTHSYRIITSLTSVVL